MTPISDRRAPALSSGQLLGGRFEVVEPIEDGGDRLWLLNDRELGSRLVAKRLNGGPSPEVAVARELRHPHLVPYFDVHTFGDLRLLTMAWIDGEHGGSLRGAAPERILEVALQIADALGYVHGRGWVHRDLKPSNILIDTSGVDATTGTAYLSDFGVAARIGDTQAPEERSAMSAGPQQWAGEPAQIGDDLYSFGALLYDWLAGRPVFWPNPTEQDVLYGRPEPLATLRPDLPKGLVTLVHGLLEKQPDHRPDLKATVSTLRAALEGLKARRGPELRPPARKPRSLRDPMSPPELTSAAPRADEPIPSLGDPLPARSVGRSAVWALGVLVLVAAAVFLWLPDWAESRPAPSTAVDATTGEPAVGTAAALSDSIPSSDVEASSGPLGVPAGAANAPEPDPMAAAAVRRQARESLAALAEAIEALESRRVETWGGRTWRDLQSGLEEGRRHFAGRRWQQALDAWSPTSDFLQTLDAVRQETVDRELIAGDRALKAFDATAAGAAFSRVLEIEPENAEAQAGLRRAQVQPRLAGLLADAADAESRGETAAAHELYRRAVALDAASAEARSGVGRTADRLAQRAFGQAFGRGSDALAARDFDGAEKAFQEARRRVASAADRAAVADAEKRLKEARRIAEIARLKTVGAQQEQAEDWRGAEATYDSALKVDAAIAFALEGRQRARQRAELSERMAFHLASPERLSTAEVLAEAERLVGRAQQVVSPGPKHTNQTAELSAWVQKYGAPVRAELISDQLTRVWIFKVGQLGTFDRRAVELRPGTYTVAGSRDGYRDVRLQWTLEPGTTPEPLVVRCEEKI